ncbi:MAG: hypothetical protein GY786_24355 [Proteobacteria bacterium]|nr:hypothetical protein [Pseudomonadota bacterium]
MNIYVCTKNVPDATATIKLVDKSTINHNIPFEMNPSDEFALEEALKLRDKNEEETQVILLTYGTDLVENMLRHGLAMGADRAVHIMCEEQPFDSRLTAGVLAEAIKQDDPPDLILTGSYSMDTEGMQTPYRLAAYFDLPVTTNIIECEFLAGEANLHREISQEEEEVLNIQLPCLIGIERADEDPRVPKIRDIMKARKKVIKKIPIEQLFPPILQDQQPVQSEIIDLELPPEKPPAKILDGSVKEMVTELISLLRNEATIL